MRILHATLLTALCLAPTFAQQQPPLIDREIFFGDPEISGSQLSPDGKYLTFVKPYEKVRNIWIKKVTEPFSAAKPLTAEKKRPIPGYFWSKDSRFVMFVQDNDGDENFNVYAVNPAEAVEGKIPTARNLSGVKGARTMLYALPVKDPDVAYIGLNDRDKAWHDLYKLKISTGEKTLLRKNEQKVSAWVFDNDGNLRLALRSAENGDTEILRVDADGLKQIYSCGVLESCAPVRFHKDGKRVYLSTNKGALDLAQLELMDVATGKTEFVERDPLKQVDFGGANFSDKTNELMATAYVGDRVRRVFYDKKMEADYNFLKSKLGNKDINLQSCDFEERMCVVSTGSDTDPGEVLLFDRSTRKLESQYKIRERVDRSALAAMEPIRYKSSDGMEIPAYLVLPKGAKRPVPLVVVPHGGPWARDYWGYNAEAQFLANRGYAVLLPNFRSSTGFGKKFLNAGDREWGQKMQDDLTWGVKHLVAEGIVDEKRVAIMGGSYGGYATLAGLAFTPDVYRAGVSIVGPSNLLTLLDSIPPYWEAARKMFYQRMGDPTTAEGKAMLMKQSPLNSADKIKTPLMVVQGANDPRVNKAESDQIVVALRDRKFPVEYLVAPDEGHGFARPVNNMAMYMAVEKFLAAHLGGRYQEGGNPEHVARLKEITVDPATVSLAKKVDVSKVDAPKPAVDLKPGTNEYNIRIEVQGQSIPMTGKTTIAEEAGNWVVTELMSSPMVGEISMVATLEKGTLLSKRHVIKQGPVVIDYAIAGDKVSGKMTMNGSDKPIDVALEGPTMADGGGASQVLASLPLADGYSTTFRYFDPQKMKPSVRVLKVLGAESVEVPAGKFDAWKVEVTPADGGAEKQTLWIAKDSRKFVKSSATAPAMGGAVVITELTK